VEIIDIEPFIEKGNICSFTNFLENYKELEQKINSFEWKKVYQPSGIFYQDRMQSYPCLETNLFERLDKELHENIKGQFQKLFKKEIIKANIGMRCTLTSELKQSTHFKDCKYGWVHTDSKWHYGAIIPFYQSINGGTAFFENNWETIPDIVYGGYPNRLIIYNANRNHASCNDYNLEKRIILTAFLKINKDA
jgi:hypothetical protein